MVNKCIIEKPVVINYLITDVDMGIFESGVRLSSCPRVIEKVALISGSSKQGNALLASVG